MSGKSKSSGLRFIWIPGRKKHQNKGHIETTRSQPQYGRHQSGGGQQMWSLGGAKNQEHLIKGTEIGDSSVGSLMSETTPAAAVLSTGCAAVVASTGEENPTVTPESDVDAADKLKKTPPGSPASESESAYGDEDPSGVHNTATLLISDKKCNGTKKKNPPSPPNAGPDDALLPSIPWDRVRTIKKCNNGDGDERHYTGSTTSSSSSASLLDADSIMRLSKLQKKDLDSIDRLDDDCVDAVKMSGGAHKYHNGADKKPLDEEKTVTCLYYTLQCCECSIS